MPDQFLLAKAGVIAGVCAGVLMLVFGRWRPLGRLAWPASLGAGFYAGCAVVDHWPVWPPAGDFQILLTLVLPALLIVEIAAAIGIVPGRLLWFFRGLIALGITPLLLQDTTYLEDKSGPGTREWLFPQLVFILAGLAALLGLVWFLLSRLEARATSALPGLLLCLTAATTGITVMQLGYAGGGQLGVPLSGALGGATLFSLFRRDAARFEGDTIFGVAGVFSVLIMGRFLGSMTTPMAVTLMLTPLVGWIPELPGLRRIGWLGRPILSGLLTAAVLAAVLWCAFNAEGDY